MPPRRSRSRERGPPCGPSLPEQHLNKPSQTSSSRAPSASSPLRMSGAYTPQPRREGPAFNMNDSSEASMIGTNGLPSNSVNTPKTRSGQREEPVLKDPRSQISIPLSPNYFDPLSKEEEETAPSPQQPEKSQATTNHTSLRKETQESRHSFLKLAETRPPPSSSSADEVEEHAAAYEAARDRGFCPTPGSSSRPANYDSGTARINSAANT